MVSPSKIFVVALLFVLACFEVSAFGVVVPYWEGHPLIMEPGETKDIALKLQNVGSDSDLTFEVNLNKGSEIAKITDKSSIYIAPKETTDTKINIRISIPQSTAVGSEYNVGVSIKDVGEKAGGMVQLTNMVSKEFKVVVGSKPPVTAATETPAPVKKVEGKSMLSTVIFLVVIVVALIAAFLLYKAKQGGVQKKAKPKSKKGTKI